MDYFPSSIANSIEQKHMQYLTLTELQWHDRLAAVTIGVLNQASLALISCMCQTSVLCLHVCTQSIFKYQLVCQVAKNHINFVNWQSSIRLDLCMITSHADNLPPSLDCRTFLEPQIPSCCFNLDILFIIAPLGICSW